jgi:hypothetical protein
MGLPGFKGNGSYLDYFTAFAVATIPGRDAEIKLKCMTKFLDLRSNKPFQAYKKIAMSVIHGHGHLLGQISQYFTPRQQPDLLPDYLKMASFAAQNVGHCLCLHAVQEHLELDRNSEHLDAYLKIALDAVQSNKLELLFVDSQVEWRILPDRLDAYLKIALTAALQHDFLGVYKLNEGVEPSCVMDVISARFNSDNYPNHVLQYIQIARAALKTNNLEWQHIPENWLPIVLSKETNSAMPATQKMTMRVAGITGPQISLCSR